MPGTRPRHHSFPAIFVLIVFVCSGMEMATAQSNIPTPLAFNGNSTVVAPPLANTAYGGGPPFGQFAFLARNQDCSMSGVLAEESNGFQFSVQLIQPGYQDNLHDLAGLTTQGDQFPNGCPMPASGNPSHLTFAYAGQASNGNIIFAMASQSQDFVISIYNGSFVPGHQQVTVVQTLMANLPNIQGVAAADLNGDGASDLIVASTANTSPAGQIEVFLGRGDGTFQASPAFTYNTPANTELTYLSVSDVNHDNKADILTVIGPVFSGSLSLQVLLGQGNGQFTTGANIPLTARANGGAYFPLLLVDINGDGSPDVVAGDDGVVGR